MSGRPRILLLADRPGWAYDRAARALAEVLQDACEPLVRYVVDRPDLAREPFDLLHVFFWGETSHEAAVTDPRRVVKEISSHRWLEPPYGPLDPLSVATTWLRRAATWTCTSRRLHELFRAFGSCHLTPNGFDPTVFHAEGRRRDGPLRIGWAGNARDPVKGLDEVLRPAAAGRVELVVADGSLAPDDMGAWYRDLDVLCVASRHEGEPLTLIEAMACGCVPIATDVGIVPELVEPGRDGLVVGRSAEAFAAAFAEVLAEPARIRAAGRRNAERLAHTRTWAHVAPHWQRAWQAALALAEGRAVTRVAVPGPDSATNVEAAESAATGEAAAMRERNLGVAVGEWPERSRIAAELIGTLPVERGGSVVDLGCGKQPLRGLLPQDTPYVPVDRIRRSADTLVLDLAHERPAGNFETALALGLLVYLDDPEPLLAWIAGHCRFAVLSFNDASDPARRARQHWRSGWSLGDFEEALDTLGFGVLASRDPAAGERVYALACPGCEASRVQVLEPRAQARPGTPVEGRRPKLALFTSALRGTNSGDALIEDAVRRLLPGCDFERLPLNHAPSEEECERAEACDLGVLCGTNLYQRVFASGLGNRVLDRLDLPLLPLGVGGSAPLDEPIVMDDEGVRAVRRIHERCPRASVRDPESLRFLERIGVTNAVLTGCPVLFHGLAEPRFEAVPSGPLHVSIRARLLHIDAAWQERSLRTLDRLARELRPVLVLQSPYDFAIAHVFSKRYDLELRFDPEMQVGPLVASARTCGATIGYRLHYGMLCLAYGRPARFIGTDTRTASFCELMGLEHLDIRHTDDDEVLRQARAPLTDPQGFVARWRILAARLAEVLAANGLPCALDAATEPVTA